MKKLDDKFEKFNKKEYEKRIKKLEKNVDVVGFIVGFGGMFWLVTFLMIIYLFQLKLIPLMVIIGLILFVFFTIFNELGKKVKLLKKEKDDDLKNLFEFEKLDDYYKKYYSKLIVDYKSLDEIVIKFTYSGQDTDDFDLEKFQFYIRIYLDRNKEDFGLIIYYNLLPNNNKQDIVDMIINDLKNKLMLNDCLYLNKYKKHIIEKIDKEINIINSLKKIEIVKNINKNIYDKSKIYCSNNFIEKFLLDIPESTRSKFLLLNDNSLKNIISDYVKKTFKNGARISEFDDNLKILEKNMIFEFVTDCISNEVVNFRNEYDSFRKKVIEESDKHYINNNADYTNKIQKYYENYHNHCWNCMSPISSAKNKRCYKCGWYICNKCSSCDPNCK